MNPLVLADHDPAAVGVIPHAARVHRRDHSILPNLNYDEVDTTCPAGAHDILGGGANLASVDVRSLNSLRPARQSERRPCGAH
jgi:hypothetical protein